MGPFAMCRVTSGAGGAPFTLSHRVDPVFLPGLSGSGMAFPRRDGRDLTTSPRICCCACVRSENESTPPIGTKGADRRADCRKMDSDCGGAGRRASS